MISGSFWLHYASSKGESNIGITLGDMMTIGREGIFVYLLTELGVHAKDAIALSWISFGLILGKGLLGESSLHYGR